MINVESWKNKLNESSNIKSEAFLRARSENAWFDANEINRMLRSITDCYLSSEHYSNWLNQYNFSNKSKTIGLIAAGNIPMVLFHDLLSILSSGNRCKLKLSEKDSVLPKWVLQCLFDVDNTFENKIEIVDRINEVDAIIATGSDLSGNLFKSYFFKYPHIIRTHRNSIAVLSGNESEQDLINLGADVFAYFGLGCRNVSKLYVPLHYDFINLLNIWDEHFSYLGINHKYKNNYDYNLAIYMLNKDKFFQANSTLLLENSSLHSRIACINFEYYNQLDLVSTELKSNADKIQDVISNCHLDGIKIKKLGDSQYPTLNDYADGIDTMLFLQNL